MRLPLAVITVACVMSPGSTSADEYTGIWLVTHVGMQRIADTPGGTFQIDGKSLRTSVGCNWIAGPVSIASGRISFGALEMTQRACGPALMALEQRYVDALRRSRSFRLDGLAMILRDEGGNAVVRLRRR